MTEKLFKGKSNADGMEGKLHPNGLEQPNPFKYQDLYSDGYAEEVDLPHAVNDFYATSGMRSDMSVFEPSMTRQEFADECDINSIMAQYDKHGVISHVNPRAPVYLDLSDVPDLQSALNLMNDATAAFMTLPAKVRAEFENDPVKFVAFAENSDNVEQMRTWGLTKPLEAPTEPLSVRVIPDPPAPPEPPKDA